MRIPVPVKTNKGEIYIPFELACELGRFAGENRVRRIQVRDGWAAFKRNGRIVIQHGRTEYILSQVI